MFINQLLALDTFSIFPPEIDGCSCCFSNDSIEFAHNKYIYANDFAQTAFLKVNGVITKFNQVDFKEIDSENIVARYQSDNYEFTIEVKDGEPIGEEARLKTGIITLNDKKGNVLRKKFYGTCGC